MFTKKIVYGHRLAGVRIVDPNVPLVASPPVAARGESDVPPVSAAPVTPAAPSEAHVLSSLELQADLDEQWAEIESFFGSIEEHLKEVEDRRRQMLGEMQQLAVELAVSIASRLVHDTIAADAFDVEKMVGQMLARFEDSESTEIRLHPADLQLLQRRVEGKRPPWADHRSYRLVADAKLQRGDCRIESGDFGMLSGVDLQLSEIRHHLMESLDNAQIERRRTQAGDSSLRRFPDRRNTA
jgi:hypothetical protein